MKYVIAALIGYAFGCINPAYIIGKIKGFDIRTKGTGNAGASNAKVTLGWGWAVFVALYDICKAILAVLATRCLFPNEYTVSVLAGCMAVWGHIFPFYLGFKAGKGFASYAGLVLILSPLWFVICAGIGVTSTLLSMWIVTATLTFTVSFPFYMYFGMHADLLSVLFVTATSLLIIVKHFPNFKKLVQHKEIGLNGCYVGTKIKVEKD